MKDYFNQQEILLFTTSSFSRRVFCSNEETKKDIPDVKQQLEEACWNGLVKEILSGIISEPTIIRKLFMWSIEEGNYSLCIELAEQPPQVRFTTSLNPNLFLHCTNFN